MSFDYFYGQQSDLFTFYVGITGDSTGNHLHFEMMQGGIRVNPLDIVTTTDYSKTNLRSSNCGVRTTFLMTFCCTKIH